MLGVKGLRVHTCECLISKLSTQLNTVTEVYLNYPCNNEVDMCNALIMMQIFFSLIASLKQVSEKCRQVQ